MAESPASAREPFSMLVHRLKCFVAGHYLEAVDVRLKDSPHEQLAAMVQGEDADVLEVCAATGFLSRIIATGFPHARVCALDLSAGMIAQGRVRAQGLHNIEFVNSDATAMPYADNSFDVVLAAFGLSVLSPAARSQCLGEIHRVLKGHGRLLVVDIDAAAHPARPLACLSEPPAQSAGSGRLGPGPRATDREPRVPVGQPSPCAGRAPALPDHRCPQASRGREHVATGGRARPSKASGWGRLARRPHRRVVEGAITRGLRPLVTLDHFTNPVWFSSAAGCGRTRRRAFSATSTRSDRSSTPGCSGSKRSTSRTSSRRSRS